MYRIDRSSCARYPLATTAARSRSGPASSSSGAPKRSASAGSRDHPLEAVAVERAAPGIGVALLTDDGDVPHLRVREALQRPGRRRSRRRRCRCPPSGSTRLSQPRAAPKRPSASAAAFTSVSTAVGTPSASRSGRTMSTRDHPGFGVAVIRPKSGCDSRSSSGPNEAMPSAEIGRPCARCRSKNDGDGRKRRGGLPERQALLRDDLTTRADHADGLAAAELDSSDEPGARGRAAHDRR